MSTRAAVASPAERPPSKGESTRALILEAAVAQASEGGFESITIGTLAARTGLSKSGLFAHFGSRAELQIAALDEAARQFTEAAFLPALKAPRGVKRLRALLENWMVWTRRAGLPGGCPIDSATREYDHRPGPMRDAVCERQRTMERELLKAVDLAVETGELARKTDVGQVAFEFLSIMLGFYRAEIVAGPEEARRRARAAFERLMREHAA